MRISKRNYGHYSSDNYGAHCLQVTIGDLTLWFSYDTVVAFRDLTEEQPQLRVLKNYWGATTGKHLNWIDGGGELKKNRLDHEQFNAALAACEQRHRLVVS